MCKPTNPRQVGLAKRVETKLDRTQGMRALASAIAKLSRRSSFMTREKEWLKKNRDKSTSSSMWTTLVWVRRCQYNVRLFSNLDLSSCDYTGYKEITQGLSSFGLLELLQVG